MYASLICLFSVILCHCSMVERINSNPASTWKAQENHISRIPKAVLKTMFNQEIAKDLISDQNTPVEEDFNAPKTFDARTKWPKAIRPIRDQGKCGSCWAFAGAAVLSDRFAIAGEDHGELSPQDLVSCDMMDKGCNGGNPLLQWTWMTLRGVTTDSCLPYVSGNGTVPKCPRKCENGSKIERVKSKSFSMILSPFLQSNLMKSGPQEFCFLVYEDFLRYKSGVYQHEEGELLGGHAVRSIGWGEENGVKYWLIANSWGTSWGDKGYFKIRRGSNECSIESMVYAGVPRLPED